MNSAQAKQFPGSMEEKTGGVEVSERNEEREHINAPCLDIFLSSYFFPLLMTVCMLAIQLEEDKPKTNQSF